MSEKLRPDSHNDGESPAKLRQVRWAEERQRRWDREWAMRDQQSVLDTDFDELF